jgi:hypothetical protein
VALKLVNCSINYHVSPKQKNELNYVNCFLRFLTPLSTKRINSGIEVMFYIFLL